MPRLVQAFVAAACHIYSVYIFLQFCFNYNILKFTTTISAFILKHPRVFCNKFTRKSILLCLIGKNVPLLIMITTVHLLWGYQFSEGGFHGGLLLLGGATALFYMAARWQTWVVPPGPEMTSSVSQSQKCGRFFSLSLSPLQIIFLGCCLCGGKVFDFLQCLALPTTFHTVTGQQLGLGFPGFPHFFPP